MASFSFASGSDSSFGATEDESQRNSRNSIQQCAIAAAAFIFAFSIARIGILSLPTTTNFFWALAYVGVIPFIASKPNLYLSIARRNIIFFLAAIFATTSSLWSLMPELSAYYGILLLLNLIVGAVIGERFEMRSVILFVFWFCFIIQGASLLLTFAHFSVTVDDGHNVRGIYASKNVLAMYACVLYLTSLLLLLAKWRPLFSLAGIMMALGNVFLSRSGTGMLMFAFITPVALSCYLIAQRRPWTVGVVGAILIVMSIGTAIAVISGFNLSDSLLAAVGKDRTLTGRTLLWDKALESFSAHPWFGIGYLSYWYSPETDASEIWILTSQELYSFHNIYLDRLVDVGIVGLSLFVAGMITLLYRCLRLLVADRSVTWAWCLTFLSFLCALGLSEYPFFWNNEFQLVISIIAAASCKSRFGAAPLPRD